MVSIVTNWDDVKFTVHHENEGNEKPTIDYQFLNLWKVFIVAVRILKKLIFLFELESLNNWINLITISRKRTFTYCFSNVINFFSLKLYTGLSMEFDKIIK